MHVGPGCSSEEYRGYSSYVALNDFKLSAGVALIISFSYIKL
jgi:hypothetical protein